MKKYKNMLVCIEDIIGDRVLVSDLNQNLFWVKEYELI